MTGRRLMSVAGHQPTRVLPRRNPKRRIATHGIDIEWNRLRANLPREACHDADSDLPRHGRSSTDRGTVRAGGSAGLFQPDDHAECVDSQRRCTRSLQASTYYTRTLAKLNRGITKRCGNRKRTVTSFRVAQPTGPRPGDERRHRHAGAEHSARPLVKQPVRAVRGCCPGARPAVPPGAVGRRGDRAC